VVSISRSDCGASEICRHTSVCAQANDGGTAVVERMGVVSGDGKDSFFMKRKGVNVFNISKRRKRI
jgi:hypothetical protein